MSCLNALPARQRHQRESTHGEEGDDGRRALSLRAVADDERERNEHRDVEQLQSVETGPSRRGMGRPSRGLNAKKEIEAQ